MRALSPDTRTAAPAYQASGRPRVHPAVENGRTATSMPSTTDNRTPSTSTAVLVPAQRTPCQPWCAEHDHAEGTCTGPTIATPGGRWGMRGHVVTTHGPVDGTLLMLNHDPDAELTVSEWMQLIQVMLDQAALALGMQR